METCTSDDTGISVNSHALHCSPANTSIPHDISTQVAVISEINPFPNTSTIPGYRQIRFPRTYANNKASAISRSNSLKCTLAICIFGWLRDYVTEQRMHLRLRTHTVNSQGHSNSDRGNTENNTAHSQRDKGYDRFNLFWASAPSCHLEVQDSRTFTRTKEKQPPVQLLNVAFRILHCAKTQPPASILTN